MARMAVMHALLIVKAGRSVTGKLSQPTPQRAASECATKDAITQGTRAA